MLEMVLARALTRMTILVTMVVLVPHTPIVNLATIATTAAPVIQLTNLQPLRQPEAEAAKTALVQLKTKHATTLMQILASLRVNSALQILASFRGAIGKGAKRSMGIILRSVRGHNTQAFVARPVPENAGASRLHILSALPRCKLSENLVVSKQRPVVAEKTEESARCGQKKCSTALTITGLSTKTAGVSSKHALRMN